jgi:hypothetical protein
VPARELYGRYRQRIEALADRPPLPNDVWLAEMREILRAFTKEARTLSPSRAHLLCWELCEQFEEEAYRAATLQRRDVLIAAVKAFEGIAGDR